MDSQVPTALQVWRGYLRNEGWLARMPERFREAMLSRTTIKRYEAGSTVVEVGEPPRGLFGLVQGRIHLSIPHIDPSPNWLVKPGDWFGEIPALTGKQHFNTARATRETVLLLVPTYALDEILDSDPAGWRCVGQLAAEHLQISAGIIADLLQRDHAKRFAGILIRLGGQRLTTDKDAKMVEIDYSQEELAMAANLARSTVNGLLKTFQERGLVDLSYRSIRIVDPARIRALILEQSGSKQRSGGSGDGEV